MKSCIFVVMSMVFLLAPLSAAQVQDGLTLGIGVIYSRTMAFSGSVEVLPLLGSGSASPTSENRGEFDLRDSGYGGRGAIGYSKLLRGFYIGGEFSIDFISSQNPIERDNGWVFSIDHGWGVDLTIVSGVLLSPKYLLYGGVGYVPRSRYVLTATHGTYGIWNDESFMGYIYSLGNRINIGLIDLRIEIRNIRSRLGQPLSGGVISVDNISRWAVEFGIVKAFGKIRS